MNEFMVRQQYVSEAEKIWWSPTFANTINPVHNTSAPTPTSAQFSHPGITTSDITNVPAPVPGYNNYG